MNSVAPPQLFNFKVEISASNVAHLIFDMPDRSMNVFSNKAIHELGSFAAWLPQSTVKGVVLSSGKTNAFCVGADLSELGEAYDMIVTARKAERFNIAYEHFFPLSKAIRALECSGKPVAAAIGGLALGGGCELVLGAHYRVLADAPSAGLGLPESLVGLFPGAGGTQRLPRIIGVEAALPILLDGERLSGKDAVKCGLVNELVAAGEEVQAAEAWVLNHANTQQPWDHSSYDPLNPVELSNSLAPERAKQLGETLGHYPAPLAILDCIEQGMAQDFDAAIRTEMSLFSYLIQRREPRNMIQTLFTGKLNYERSSAKQNLAEDVKRCIEELTDRIGKLAINKTLAKMGFAPCLNPTQVRVREGYWFRQCESQSSLEDLRELDGILRLARDLSKTMRPDQQLMVDYAVVSSTSFPAYLGGPISLAAEFDSLISR